jgi:hypothetical protein
MDAIRVQKLSFWQYFFYLYNAGLSSRGNNWVKVLSGFSELNIASLISTVAFDNRKVTPQRHL